MGDAVFDVVERGVEEMALALPEGFANVFISRPIELAAETIDQAEPELFAIVPAVAGMSVEPVLERIDA